MPADRPLRLTREIHEAILGLVITVLYLEMIAARVGVSARASRRCHKSGNVELGRRDVTETTNSRRDLHDHLTRDSAKTQSLISSESIDEAIDFEGSMDADITSTSDIKRVNGRSVGTTVTTTELLVAERLPSDCADKKLSPKPTEPCVDGQRRGDKIPAGSSDKKLLQKPTDCKEEGQCCPSSHTTSLMGSVEGTKFLPTVPTKSSYRNQPTTRRRCKTSA